MVPNKYPRRVGSNKQRIARAFDHLIPNQKQLLDLPYFHGSMSTKEANIMLAGRPRNTFLLRRTKRGEEWSLSLSLRKDYRHYSYDLPPGPNDDGSYYVNTVIHNENFITHSGPYGHPMEFDQIRESHARECDCLKTTGQYCRKCDCLLEGAEDTTKPFFRQSVFSLKELAKAVISDHTTYQQVEKLPLPVSLQKELRQLSVRTKERDPPKTPICIGGFGRYNWDLGTGEGEVSAGVYVPPEYQGRRNSEEWCPIVEGPISKYGETPQLI